MNKSKKIVALKNTVLLIAAVHLVLLLIYALAVQNFTYLTLADILDVKLFFPTFKESVVTNVAGGAIIAGIFLYFYRS